MSLFNRHKKVDPNKMSPEQLEDYVNQLPEQAPPPKWSTVGWCGAGGLICAILFAMRISKTGFTSENILLLVGAISMFLGTGYLIYKIINANK